MKLRYMLMLSLFFVAAVASAQEPVLRLKQYTVPVAAQGAAISRIYEGKETASGAKLVADTSGLFMVRKGELRLKKDRQLLAADPAFKYAVTLEHKGITQEFILVKDQFSRNRVIAHRGAWKNNAGSQNSLSSLKDAVRLGCAGSEFDVWMSSDGIPVLSHDPVIGGKKVEETTAAELTRIELKNGDHVPLFEDYLKAAMEQNITRLVLELKPSDVSKERGQQLAQAAMDLIGKYKCQAWMQYISFDYDICKKLVELDPFAPVAYLMGDKQPKTLKADGMWGLDYYFKVIDKDMNILADARKHGLTTNIWTVNDGDKMDTYLKAGVDFLTTDEPELLLQKVK